MLNKNKIKGFLIDLEGVLYNGDTLIDGSIETISFLKANSFKIRFLTNTTTTPRKSIIEKLKKTIRSEASPRHVPAKILEVSDIPRTKNGKIVELAVKNIIEGNKIKNIQALANPEILKKYKNIKELET